MMFFITMTIYATHIVFTHMNINIICRFIQTAVHIIMFNTISAAAAKVTCSTVFIFRISNILCNFYKIRPFISYFITFKKFFFFFINRITCCCWKFFISACLIMTNQTIDLFTVGKIKIFVFPAITCMTACTSWFI